MSTHAPSPDQPRHLTGTAVAMGRGAVLLTGPSGSGKSSTALKLIALGARLIGDDQLLARREGREIRLAPVPGFAGQIEARFAGILRVPHMEDAPLCLIADLSQNEAKRLPPLRARAICGLQIPLLHAGTIVALDAVLAALLKGERIA